MNRHVPPGCPTATANRLRGLRRGFACWRGQAPRISATSRRFDPRTIRGYYQLGRYIERRFATEIKRLAKAGQNTRAVPGLGQQLCAELKISRSILDGSRFFARRFTPAQVQELVQLRGPDQFRLTRRHVIALLSVKQNPAAMQLARECVKQGWSANRLHGIIRERFAQSKRGGRPPATAATRGEFLQQLVEVSQRWLRWWGSQCRTDEGDPASAPVLPEAFFHDCQYQAERLTELADRADRYLAQAREKGRHKERVQ